MTLHKLIKNQRAIIKKMPINSLLSSQLMQQGFFVSSEVTLAHKAPFNGPIAFNLHGTKICISKTVASQIEVELV